MKAMRTVVLVGALCVCGMGPLIARQQPGGDAVILAIDAAIQSLSQQPNQFRLNVTVVGAIGTASGGGTGIHVEAHGGAPGSQTTGLVASASSAQVEIAQSTADAALRQEAEKAVGLLTEIKSLLQAKKVDKPAVTSRLGEFAKTYVAPVLKSVIEALVKKKLGL